MSDALIGYPEALDLTLSHIRSPAAGPLPVLGCTDGVCGKDLYARVDAPSLDTSLKDGYAVRSGDLAGASAQTPVKLRISGIAAAGGPIPSRVLSGFTLRVLTGAAIPEGADAVIAEESTRVMGDGISVDRPVSPGRDILSRGADVRKGEIILRRGDLLTPASIGLAVAAGYETVSAVATPRVAILATGDEVVLPGEALPEGKLFASNMATLHAWCRRLGVKTRPDVVADDEQKVAGALARAAGENDMVITSGGAWMGDRDLVVRMLSGLGWRKIYHRVRMGPGKAVGFGFLGETPVFVLPGSPPACLTAFLFLALPALMKLAGRKSAALRRQPARLRQAVEGKKDRTRFLFGKLRQEDRTIWFVPVKTSSRLKSMAAADSILTIPEGVDVLPAGTEITGAVIE